MNVEERLDNWLPKLKEAKEKVVKDFPYDPDGPAVVEVYRADQAVCTMMFMSDVDLMLLLIKFGIIGMEADMVGFATETISTSHVVNPGTGKPWGPEEAMEVLRNRPDYWFDGLVEESLTTTIWDRSGNAIQSVNPFELNGTEVIWKEAKRFDQPMEGPVTDEISMYWHDDTLAEQAVKATSGEHPDLSRLPRPFLDAIKTEIENMSTVERQARQDISTLMYLHNVVRQIGAMVSFALTAEAGSEREAYLKTRAPLLAAFGAGVSNPIV